MQEPRIRPKLPRDLTSSSLVVYSIYILLQNGHLSETHLHVILGIMNVATGNLFLTNFQSIFVVCFNPSWPCCLCPFSFASFVSSFVWHRSSVSCYVRSFLERFQHLIKRTRELEGEREKCFDAPVRLSIVTSRANVKLPIVQSGTLRRLCADILLFNKKKMAKGPSRLLWHGRNANWVFFQIFVDQIRRKKKKQ